MEWLYSTDDGEYTDEVVGDGKMLQIGLPGWAMNTWSARLGDLLLPSQGCRRQLVECGRGTCVHRRDHLQDLQPSDRQVIPT